MDADLLKKRGKLVDELQERMHTLQRRGKAVPPEYQEKIKAIVETQDTKVLAETELWMNTELPPKEYQTEEITWETFSYWSAHLLRSLTIHAMQLFLLGEAEANKVLVDLMKEIKAIKGATDSPVVAMNELTKIRARAIAAAQDLHLGE